MILIKIIINFINHPLCEIHHLYDDDCDEHEVSLLYYDIYMHLDVFNV